MMLIGYKTMHKAIMDMATVVVTQVGVISKVMVVCLDEAKLFATTVIRQAI